MTQASAHGEIGTPEEIAYEARAQEGSIWTGGRLLIGVMAFAYAALAFSYFYLRSTNSSDLWRPHDITAPTAWGAAIMSLTVASAVVVGFGLRRLRLGMATDWAVSWWSAVLGAVLAFALQIWEMTTVPWAAPGMSGYTSVWTAWAGMNLLLLFGGFYWLETILARHMRLRKAVKQSGGDEAILITDRLFRVNVESCAFFWGFIAVVGLFFWVFFYLT